MKNETDDIYYPDFEEERKKTKQDYINSYYGHEDVTALRVGCAIVIVGAIISLTLIVIGIMNLIDLITK